MKLDLSIADLKPLHNTVALGVYATLRGRTATIKVAFFADGPERVVLFGVCAVHQDLVSTLTIPRAEFDARPVDPTNAAVEAAWALETLGYKLYVEETEGNHT